MSEQKKKKGERINDLLNVKTSQNNLSFFVYRIQSKEDFFFLQEKSFLRKRGSGRLYRKRKEGFLSALATAIKKDTHNVNKKAR